MRARIKKRLAVRCWQCLKWLTSKADGCYGWRVLIECLHQTVVILSIQDMDQTVPASCGQQLQSWQLWDNLITYSINSHCTNTLKAGHHYNRWHTRTHTHTHTHTHWPVSGLLYSRQRISASWASTFRISSMLLRSWTLYNINSHFFRMEVTSLSHQSLF